jgi:hypothetical protein
MVKKIIYMLFLFLSSGILNAQVFVSTKIQTHNVTIISLNDTIIREPFEWEKYEYARWLFPTKIEILPDTLHFDYTLDSLYPPDSDYFRALLPFVLVEYANDTIKFLDNRTNELLFSGLLYSNTILFDLHMVNFTSQTENSSFSRSYKSTRKMEIDSLVNQLTSLNDTIKVYHWQIILERTEYSNTRSMNFFDQLLAYPNPSPSGVYTIKNLETIKPITIFINELNGRQADWKYVTYEDYITLEILGENGLYILSVKTQDKLFTLKLLKNSF